MKKDFLLPLYAAVSGMALLLLPANAHSLCTTCHSKNPKLVAMHKALGFKDCFKCHPLKASTPAELKAQMAADPLCTRCHGAGKGKTEEAGKPLR
ncbi:MAG: hypothetical protein M0Z59_04015 [Nitrospiraceae bacterium]|nr:hypothetical protein [Nitrospiraceae bacterium]